MRLAGSLCEIPPPAIVSGIPKQTYKHVTVNIHMSIKKPITFLCSIIALAFVLVLSNSNYVIVISAQQQQHSTNTQKTNGTLARQNNVSILPQVPADRSFSPNVINVIIGDTVTWTNHDGIPHTVTSGTGPADPNKGKEFDSGLSTLLTPGKTFFHKFTRAGEFQYFCQLHPAMTGTVTVA
ncbi:MAG: plastocyanin/azurin family copper-binding protein [Nitrososphaeraceae archaeon]